MRAIRHILTLLCCCGALLMALPKAAHAQSSQLAMPRIGQRFLSIGVLSQPGLILGDERAKGSAYARSYAHGELVSLGFHQILNTQLMMQGHIALGLQFIDEHNASQSGQAPSEIAPALELGLKARWIPSQQLQGFTLGAGVNLYRAWLDDAPAQLMGFELGCGLLQWADDEHMVLLELSYIAPLIQGLSLPEQFRAPDPSTPAPPDWSWQRLSLNIQWTF